MAGISGMDRRELLQRALLLVGASLLPLGDQAHADSTPAKTRIGPRELALITAVADTIIPKTDTPGAVEAGVPQTFAAMLGTWASPARRADLIEAFDKIDQLAKQKRGRSFTELTPGERHELLAAHDAAALQPAQNNSSPLIPKYADPAYAKLKELIVMLFYLSESALTHELVYEHTPGAWRPSVPVTPETRNVGGLSSL
ncbi:gluconate 2-dehydrogenase subunit 3 family protein [Steroidobacter flavus]|uniref:Gluconate 2-dehydrogenase subunit 3 family protein n=1 Tax=Steroidobacter flavus TaxID=1842136 RepID=A0ABV8SY49_9GAMM